MHDHAKFNEEERYFDQVIQQTGETWWGNRTPAGLVRLRRRATKTLVHLGLFQDPVVLEIGCGTGLFSKLLLEGRPDLNLVSCDISKEALQLADGNCCRFSRFKSIHRDAKNLDFSEHSFDVIIGNSILHHLCPIELILEHYYKLLKPSGLLWFSEPNMLNPHNAIEKNIRPIGRWLQATPDETAFFRWKLKRQLKTAGFQFVEVIPYDFLYPLVPSHFIPLVDRMGQLLERVPILREIAGSIEMIARK